MSVQDFSAEEVIIDKYVELKESKQDGDELIFELVMKYFLPQGRIVESEMWSVVLSNNRLKTDIKKQLLDYETKSESILISRMPKNKNWIHSDIFKPAQFSEDQQYHYDRTLNILNAQQIMLDNRDDVIECRNEWVTFEAKGAYVGDNNGGLASKGAQMNTIAMAIQDYIEFILIPNKFVETKFNLKPVEQNETSFFTLEKTYSEDQDQIKYLNEYHPELMKELFLMNFYAGPELFGKQEEIVVTENYVAFLPAKKRGWSVSSGSLISRASVNCISIGSESHTEYQGITSTDSFYWTFTFETNDFQQFTRYLYLGKNESEMNQNRPEVGRIIQKLSEFFELTEGESYSSTGGYTTSYGYGWWMS
jgi:hypothetical protein